MSRDPNPVTVVLPIGAALLRRLDAVAADLHLKPSTRPSCAGLSRKSAKPPSATACARYGR